MTNSLAEGFTAVVVGASGGIGAAVHAALEADPRCASVVGLSRRDGLDLVNEESVAEAVAGLRSPAIAPTLVFVATGALQIDGYGPEKSLRTLTPEGMAAQFALNAIGPALLLKHLAPLLPRDRRSLFAVLSARVGSIGDNRLGGWISYRAAKAALNQIVRTGAIELARTHPRAVVAALHPGTVATALSEPFAGKRVRLTPNDSASALLRTLDSLTAEQSGGFYAYDGSRVEW